MENIVVCSHCGAKLKIKPGVKKVMKEIKCGKCRKSIALTTEPDTENVSPQSSIQSSPTPPAQSAPTAPDTGDAKTITDASPSSAAAPVTAAPPPTPSPAPKREAVSTAAPSAPGPVPTTQPPAGPMLESRFAALEKKVAELQQVIDALCKADAEAAKKRIAEIDKIANRV